MFTRTQTRTLKLGNLALGGGAPVSVQTMANVDPHNAAALSAQLMRCAELGCEVYRMTVPDAAAAETLGLVRRTSPIPIVADIHFDYRAALAALAAGTDALRLNPGNIGSRDRVQAVARAAKERHVPIRIGVNLGSLEKGLVAALARHELSIPEALVQSALGHLKLLEDEGFRDVAISAKASNVADTLATYRLLAERTDCPLHIGVTEAGTLLPGTVRSSVALGILLSEGLGDTIRVSLTAEPEKEVRVGLEILRALGLKSPGPSVTSCPTCGRTRVPVQAVAEQVEEALERRARALGRKTYPHIAVMGCAVNGPGEARGADIALCGGDGEFLIYVKGQPVGKVSQDAAVERVMEYAFSL